MSPLLLGFAVLVMAPLVVLGNDTKGVVVEKSFLQSIQDCVECLQIPKQRLVQYLAYEFPPDEETKCLIHCVGTDLRWWNNTCGVQFPAIVNFFQPVQGDRQYEKRTRECLERNVRSVQQPNSCCQAYETFQCYFSEFGNLVTCPQYVPATRLQATQAALDCLTMLRVPVNLLRCYSKGDLPDEHETRCMYHCIDLRTGLYTPETGIQLSRFYVRDLEVDDLRYLSKETKACRDRIRQSGCESCSEVYTTHRDCLSGIGTANYTSSLITEAAKIALANLGVCCTEKLEVVVPEVGYSYASYQTGTVPSSKVCACSKQAPVPLQPAHSAERLVSYKPPSYGPPSKPCRPRLEGPKTFVQSGTYPKAVAAHGNLKMDPFAKRNPLRPQMVHYPAPLPLEVSPPSAYKPAFSTFSVRSYPDRSLGPYPSCASSTSDC